MQGILGQLEDLGASLVAITGQVHEFSRLMIADHGLNYHLLSDPGHQYAAQLGLRFTFSDELKAVYKEGFGNDLARFNGDESWTLPMPARLVVDRGGIVRAADIDPDYTRRPEPEKTLADVKALA